VLKTSTVRWGSQGEGGKSWGGWWGNPRLHIYNVAGNNIPRYIIKICYNNDDIENVERIVVEE
jgi:hypothetical protein